MNYKPFDDQNKIILLINIDEYQVENKLIENAIEDEFSSFHFIEYSFVNVIPLNY